MGKAVARVDRAERILRGFDDALTRQEQFIGALPEDILPRLAKTLTEQAEGIWYEKEQVTKDGKKVKRVYRRAPDSKAADMLMRLMAPREQSSTLLDYMRGQQLAQEIDAGTAKAKAANLASQTALNQENASVFKKMLITQEDYEEAVLGIGSHAIREIQAIPRTQMLAICQSEEQYQAWMKKFVQHMMDESKGIIKADSERLLLEAGDEEGEDGDGD